MTFRGFQADLASPDLLTPRVHKRHTPCMRTRAAFLVAVTPLLLGLGLVGPAEATGGPPTITSLSPSPVAASGSLTVTGTGCDPSSPVSFHLWATAGGPTLNVNSADSGAVANGAGAFSHAIALTGQFGPGTEVGVVALCAAVYAEGPLVSDPGADQSYVLIQLLDPTVDLSVDASPRYASRPTVTVVTSDAPGSLYVRLDGSEVVYLSGTGFGDHTFRLPASLALGTHTLVAEFDPLTGGAPTVTDTVTLVVTQATSRLALKRANHKRVKVGKKVKLTVVLGSDGPRTGTIVVREGAKVRRTIRLKIADDGSKTFRIKMTTLGTRMLKAKFAGNTYVLRSKSGKLKVKVVE